MKAKLSNYFINYFYAIVVASCKQFHQKFIETYRRKDRSNAAEYEENHQTTNVMIHPDM